MVMAIKGLAEKEEMYRPKEVQAQLKEMKVPAKAKKERNDPSIPVCG